MQGSHLGLMTVVLIAAIVYVVAIAAFGYNVSTDVAELSERRADILDAEANGQVAGVAVETTRVVFDRGSGSSRSVEINLEPGMTLQEAADQAAEAFSMNLVVRQMEGRERIIRLDDQWAVPDQYEWRLYYNGRREEASILSEPAQGGDELRLEYYPL